MGIFIDVLVDENLCEFSKGCDKCITICPVDIFYNQSGRLGIKDEDECTLCDQCLEVCPTNAIKIVKKY